MKYHINIEYGNQTYSRWNYEKDELISKFVVPFINGQVVMLRRMEGVRLVNMKSVTSMIIYRTPFDIYPQEHHLTPDEFRNPNFSDYECTKEVIDEILEDKMALPSRSLLQMAVSPPENKVFVIMKFGDEQLDSLYELAIKPVVHTFGLECVRIDEIRDSGVITDQVLEQIATSRFVIADLTGDRPNCYYETGFAHALGKELILTIQSSEKPHFDLQGNRFIAWHSPKHLHDELMMRFESLTKYKQLLYKKRPDIVSV